jgi:hypothetical protein
MFKGDVIVDVLYNPRALSSKIHVRIRYNEVYIEDVSQNIEDYTKTTSVLDILFELADRLKKQYDKKLSEKEDIIMR